MWVLSRARSNPAAQKLPIHRVAHGGVLASPRGMAIGMPHGNELWDTFQMAKRQQRVSNLRSYAVIGAEQRLLQIAEEARAIFKAFPELRAPNRGVGARGGEGPFPWQKQAAQEGGLVGNGRRHKGKRRRRKMSAAARKRISEAQKARWAKQKAREARPGRPAAK